MNGKNSVRGQSMSMVTPRRQRLLGGTAVAAVALGATLGAPALAAGPTAFSPAWYSQRSAQTGTAVAGAPAPIGLTPAQQQQIATSRASVIRAADALRSVRTVQSAAQAAARAAAFTRPDGRVVTDGLGKSGLYFARGASAGDSYDVTTAAARAGAPSANGLVWQGAELPGQKANTDVVAGTTTTGTGATASTVVNGKLVETAAAGNTLVTVKQTQSRAILTWQNFDVGANTTLYFQQTAADGTPQRDWVVLNRVLAGPKSASQARVTIDAQGKQVLPSLILGKIKGDGEVLVINQNGILFGAGSQVNTTAFSASTLDAGLPFQTLAERNNYFLTNVSGRNNYSYQYLLEEDAERIRLYGRLKVVLKRELGLVDTSTAFIRNRSTTIYRYVAKLAEDAVEGNVVVEQGAQIITGSLDTKGQPIGLFANNVAVPRVVLAAPTVINNGELRADDGQVLLIGGRNYSLYTNDGLSGKAIDTSVRGALVDVGQQDLTFVARDTAAGAVRANPFIQQSLNVTIFGNAPEPNRNTESPPQNELTPARIVGVAQGGENYDPTKPIDFFNTDFDRLLVQVDSRGRRFIESRVFYNTEELATAFGGSVVNNGLVSAPRGSILARAANILQDGILHATTSVNQAGLIDLRAQNVTFQTPTFFETNGRPALGQSIETNRLGAVTLAGSSITTILPDEQLQLDGTPKTITSDPLSLANFRRSEVRIYTENTARLTPAERAASRTVRGYDRYVGNIGSFGGVQSLNAGAVSLAAGSLLAVPSGNISIRASAPAEQVTPNTYRPAGTGPALVPPEGSSVLILPETIVAGVSVAGETTVDGVTTPGAIIDVAGLTDVELPMSSNIITVARVGQNELADSPLQRNAFIYRQRNILVDRRLSGVREDGFAWLGTPLFDASGYINARAQLVTELMTAGGNIDFGGAVTVGRSALLNIAGGLITYAAGNAATTQLLTADGKRTVAIGRANPLETYSGFAGQFTEDHSRWGVSTTYTGLGLSVQNSFEESYVEGANAGRISFSSTPQGYDPLAAQQPTSTRTPLTAAAPLLAFDGRINAGVVAGPYQRQGSAYYNAANPSTKPLPRGGTLDLSAVLASTVTLASSADLEALRIAEPAKFLPDDAAAGDGFASSVFLNQYWSTDALSESGLANLTFGFRGFAARTNGFDLPIAPTALIAIGSDANPVADAPAFAGQATTLSLPNGAALTINARNIQVDGTITAHGGSLDFALVTGRFADVDYLPSNLTTAFFQPTTALLPRSSFTLGEGAVLDVSGIFVNDINATRDSLVGFDFVNGGSVTVRSTSILNTVDFRPTSRVELSSGGYVTASGRLGTTGAAGLGRGRGGNLSLQISGLTSGNYVPLSPETDPLLVPGIAGEDTREQIASSLLLDGAINAFGFQGGGTFTLSAPDIVIGEGSDGGDLGRVTLTPGFFTDHGFGAFNLTALLTARIDDGVQLVLSQQQYLPGASVATALSLGEAAVLGRYAGASLQRAPVNFSLTGNGFGDFNSKGFLFFDPGGGPATPLATAVSYTSANALTVGAGAAIIGDAGGVSLTGRSGAEITLAATGQMRLGEDGAAGGISARGGVVTIRQRFGSLGATTFGGGSPADAALVPLGFQSAILDSGFAIDASGIGLTDLRITDRRAGVVTNGGTVVLDGAALIRPDTQTRLGDIGLIVGRTGSSINVSGAAGTIDLPTDDLVRSFTPTTVASAAGTIRLSNASLNTKLSGAGGDQTQAGGTLDIQTNAVFQSTQLNADELQAGMIPVVLPASNNGAYGALTVDSLTGSGIDALVLRGNPVFYGNLDISLGRSITLLSSSIGFSPYGPAPAPVAGAAPVVDTVRISAPSVRILSPVAAVPARPAITPPLPAAGAETAQLLLEGTNGIDINGTVNVGGFATTRLQSEGDLRFVPQLVLQQRTSGSSVPFEYFYNYNSLLSSTGDIVVDAAQIYPATGVSATIRAGRGGGLLSDNPGSRTITILPGNNTATAPLSAGGSLTLDAGTIVQRGVVRAPLGTINLGVAGVTANVDVQAGSLTSVSADGLLIPYGQTRNGTTWIYSGLSGSNLTAAPDKVIQINAAQAELAAGATIDLSGGGDVFATEFIPGLGGQRNVLSTTLTNAPSANTDTSFGPAVYAILPGQQPLVSPVDPDGYPIDSRGRTGIVPLPGQTLTLLADAGDLKAGTYTLYAGSYATQPGAYRVEAVPATTDYPGGAASTLADGSVVVGGRLGANGTALSSSRATGYRVFSNDAWRQYSQISTTSGNAFFKAQAAAAGVAPAPLPVDAGRLQIIVTAADKALRTMALLKFGTPSGGRGGQVDIAAPRIAVVSAALQPGLAADLAGSLVFTPQEISAFNASSVLLGATRTSSFAGDSLDVVATSIRIATTGADPLRNPELLFATSGGPTLLDNGIFVDAGSAVLASGAVTGAGSQAISFAPRSADGFEQITDGTLLRLSNGGPVTVTRSAPPAVSLGRIVIASTAAAPTRLDGGAALQLDAGGDLLLDTTALLGGASIDLFSQRILFSDDASGGGTTIGGAALQVLAGAKNLTLNAAQSITFGQPLRIAAAAGAPRIQRLTLNTPVLKADNFAGGGLLLDATAIVLSNSFALPAGQTALAGDGVFTTNSETLSLTGKNRVTQGFDTFNFTATKSVVFGDGEGVGTLTLPGDVELRTPLITLAEGSDQSLIATGTITTTASATTAPIAASDIIAGRLLLDAGGKVTIGNVISARAGRLDVRARGGDIVLAGGSLLANGYTQSFKDKDVILAGGIVTLVADSGNVEIGASSVIDVAAAPRGNGGQLDIVIGSAGKSFLSNGTLRGASGGGATLGAEFALDSEGAVALEPLAQQVVAAGFTGGFAVRSAQGNLALTGTSITAHDVRLVADDRSAGNGFVTVATTIDASGPEGGTIGLYGQRGVTLTSTGKLLARATVAAVDDRGGRGGTVSVGTGVLSSDDVVQNAGGRIELAAGSVIDVSDALDAQGNSTYNLGRGGNGATVNIRAPIIYAGGTPTVDVAIGSSFVGARTLVLETFRRFTTQNSEFDGIVDPAGWFNADGSYVAGTWTDPYGGIVKPGDVQNGVADPKNFTEASYFAPITYDIFTGAETDTSNAAHVDFYNFKKGTNTPGTLLAFVQNTGVDTGQFAGVTGLRIRPGIELVNSDGSLNGGDIKVLSNWNFGAGSTASDLFYRTGAGEPGVLTLRAVGNIDVKASVSDGFYRATQYNPYSGFNYSYEKLVSDETPNNPTPPRFPAVFGQRIGDPPSFDASQYYHNYDYYAKRLRLTWTYLVSAYGGNTGTVAVVPFAPLNYVAPTTNYAAYSVAYRDYLDNQIDAYNAQVTADNLNGGFQRNYRRPIAPVAPTDNSQYGNYAANYYAFADKIVQFNNDPVLSARATVGLPPPLPPSPNHNTAAYAEFYAPTANLIGNNAKAGDPLSVASAELNTSGFSWSYNIVAGSNTNSVDTQALRSRAAAVTIDHAGDLTLGTNGVTAATRLGSNNVIRTGTGSIDIATAGDVRWVNGNDTIYTAGIDNGPNAGFVDRAAFLRTNPENPTTTATQENSSIPVVNGQAEIKGVFARQGGDIRVTSRGDLIGAPDKGTFLSGFRSPVAADGNGIADEAIQAGEVDSVGSASLPTGLTDTSAVRGVVGHEVQGLSSSLPSIEGQFGGISLRARPGRADLGIPNLQSAEWVNTGDVGSSIIAFGGGNITLDAGGDILDVQASVMSSFQSSGGKIGVIDPANPAVTGVIPVTIERYGGGNLSVTAGGDIAGVSFFLGRGNGSITAGGALTSRTGTTTQIDGFDDLASLVLNPRDPLTFEERSLLPPILIPTVTGNSLTSQNGILAVTARTGVDQTSLFSFQGLDQSFFGVFPEGEPEATIIPLNPRPFSQLGTESAVSIVTASGDLKFVGTSNNLLSAPVPEYAPQLTLAAVRGNLDIVDSVVLAPSPKGSLDLLAFGDVTFGSTSASSLLAPPDVTNGQQIRMDDRAQSQISTAENPEPGVGRPLFPDRFALHNPTAQPLHFNDTAASHIIALNGDIINGRGLDTDPVPGRAAGLLTTVTLAEQGVISAGRDIIDLRFVGQNSTADSITSITAGRDITYTFVPAFNVDGSQTSLPGGGTYSIGGTGRLALVAGRNLSLAASLPARLVANPDPRGSNPPLTITAPGVAQGVLSVGNDINPYLAQSSASIDLLFGVGPTIGQPGNANIAGFVDTYVNPANASLLPKSYSAELAAFINDRLTRAARELDPTTSFVSNLGVDAAWAAFQLLDANRQRTFVDEVFYNELRIIADPSDRAQFQNFARAYAAVDTLFPGDSGYTDNLADPVARVQTGDLEMSSALVRTSYGGGINILGPGGGAILGGLAIDSRPQGILTLRGGPINIFLDGSLAVNTSRIFTLLGGDETIFSTNGNIDAGRGRRTAAILPPLVVSYLPTTSASVDFGGLVSGAGIGTIRSVPGSPPANVFLLAPRGDIDAGDAGIRASGNLQIVAVRVLNADNIQAGGSSTGVPQVPTVDAAQVATASNTSAAAGETQSSAAQRPLDQQAIINVDVRGCSDDDLLAGRCTQ